MAAVADSSSFVVEHSDVNAEHSVFDNRVYSDMVETCDSHTPHSSRHFDGPATDLSWTSIAKMTVAVLVHSVASGIVGIVVFHLIEEVQLLGFEDDEVSHGFRSMVESAPPWRRIASVTAGGVFAALSWYTLRGMEPRIVPVNLSLEGEVMPPLMTLANAAIQDIAVALGGSFGREAAPREIAAMLGGAIGDCFKVSRAQRRVLVACGTGAGLAAVYSVPISGALYTIEHILEWDASMGAIIPAVVSSCIATWVSHTTVPTQGLYQIGVYYNTWPSMAILVWSVFIGPIAGTAAHFFMAFMGVVRPFRPRARVPVPFGEAYEGQRVRVFSFYEKDGHVLHRYEDAVIHQKTAACIWTKAPGREGLKQYDQRAWAQADVEGPRDWKILILMPAAFFVLAITSVIFPTLLGNGKALAEVAIKRERYTYQLVMLFFLKAFMTGAAIGSGADGGTLTPSVALGAVMGVVIACTLHFLCGFEVAPVELMAMISAAAFLGASMQAPVTAVWLIVEFSAQVVPMSAFASAARGDFSPLLESKAAIGFLLPLSLATFLSFRTFVYWKSRPRRRASSDGYRGAGARPGVDLDLGHDYDDISTELTSEATSTGFSCFHTGLLSNTCITLAVAAASPSEVRRITRIALAGLLCSVFVALASWALCMAASLPTGVSSIALSGDSATYASPLLGGKPTAAPSPSAKMRKALRKRNLKAVGFVMMCACLGAVMPAVPWLLRIWDPDPWSAAEITEAQAQHGGHLSMVVSVGCTVMATAIAADIDATMEYSIHTSASSMDRPKAVAKRAGLAFAVAVGALLVGAASAVFRHT